jgi:tetratricopeptide (TPR) repeat protein
MKISDRTLPVMVLILALCALPAAASAQSSRIFDILPGASTKAETDLILGEPLKKLKTDSFVYQYAPPTANRDAEKVIVTYFADTKQVSRIDIYMKTPMAAEGLRDELGHRVLQRDREDGNSEEIYYPKLMALVLAGKAQGASVIATSFLSARYLADIYIDRCSAKLRNNEYSDAHDEADKAVLVDPNYARGYLAQGRSFHAQKNYEEAIVRFTAAVGAKYSPISKADAHLWLGYTYWKQKNLLDKAREEYQNAVATAPEQASPHFEFSRFLRAQKQLDRAAAELLRAVELNPDNAEMRLDAVSLFNERKDYPAAIPHYEWLSRWLETDAASDRDQDFKSRLLFEFGYALAGAGQHEKAIQAYERALQRNPNNLTAHNNLGFEYEKRGDPAKAEEQYRIGLKLDPSYLLLNQNLVRLLLATNRPEEARLQAEKALALKSGDTSTMVLIARAWAAQGKKKQALNWIEKAAAAGFKNAAALTDDSSFASLRENGDFKKLIAQMGQAQ